MRKSKFTWNYINYLQLQFLDGLVFELLANVAVVRKCFILLIYPSSWSAASLALGTAVVATRSSTRDSTGEYFELGVSVDMLRKFQVKKKSLGSRRNHRLCDTLNNQAVQGLLLSKVHWVVHVNIIIRHYTKMNNS